MAEPAVIDELGPRAEALARLRVVIDDFYSRLVDDVMIGFLFAGKDRARLVEKEWEFTARFLGADLPYTGRAIRVAHAHSPILGGHFERRLQILRETLDAHRLPFHVQWTWIEHTLALRSQVTADQGSECSEIRDPPPEPSLAEQLTHAPDEPARPDEPVAADGPVALGTGRPPGKTPGLVVKLGKR
jgi:hemoglobin